jgi:hypothetical protein
MASTPPNKSDLGENTTPVMVSPPASPPAHTTKLPTPTAQLALAMDWVSVVRSHKLGLEHAAIDIDTDRVLYHMELELATPLPAGAGLPGQFLCLTWPYGGLWKIERVTDGNTKVKCLSWRKTEMQLHEMEELARSANALANKVEAGHSVDAPSVVPGRTTVTQVDQVKDDQVGLVDETPDLYPTLFEWKMIRGEWESDVTHWFIRDVEPPAKDDERESNLKRKLLVTLFAGFDPLEASVEVNAITALDTVAQTYSADVTWQVMFPAITALREDSVLREFLDLLDIDANQFEFTNVAEMSDQRELTSSLVPAGDVQFRDVTLPDERSVMEDVYHLTFRRRVCASFTTEMALHSFPFDQQKLLFEFTTGSGMLDTSVILVPAPVEPGSFSVENYQLGNIFDVLYHNKVFVSTIRESGPRKEICFEMVLQRRSGYYLTNVAVIAAIITYLCFVTYATDKDGEFMDMGSRLQVVSALVLTAVTFKNQVASLIPQISYFTMLDSYVFVCFIVSTIVTVENALFPMVNRFFSDDRWSEKGLLGFSIGTFTLFNVCCAVYIRWWLGRRHKVALNLMQVHEYIREISNVIPTKYRARVLERFLAAKEFEDWCRPKYIVTSTGDIHIQAPDDVPPENAVHKAARIATAEKQKAAARSEIAQYKKIYFDMRPGLERRASAPMAGSPVLGRGPAGRLPLSPDSAAQAKRRPGNPTYGSTSAVGIRTTSHNTYFHDHEINMEPVRSEPHRRHQGTADGIRVEPHRRPRRASHGRNKSARRAVV